MSQDFFIDDDLIINPAHIIAVTPEEIRLTGEISIQIEGALFRKLKSHLAQKEGGTISRPEIPTRKQSQSAVVADGRRPLQTTLSPEMPPDAPQPCILSRS